MGKKLTAKTWLVISLILCFVSMAVSSVIQSSGGRVKVSELRLVDSTGHEVSALLYKPKSATEENKSPAIVTVICPLSSRQVKYLKLDVDDACISF